MKVSLSVLLWTGASTLVSSLCLPRDTRHPNSYHTHFMISITTLFIQKIHNTLYKHYFLTFFIYFIHRIKQNFKTVHNQCCALLVIFQFRYNLVVIHMEFRKMCIVPIVKLFENRFDAIDSCSLIQHMRL